MIPRIYIDTSVVGGFFDEEFEMATKLLFQQHKNKEIIFVISDLLRDELKPAPQHIKIFLMIMMKVFFENVVSTEISDSLAQKYVDEKVVGKTSFDDCRHIAITTINKVDVLASWNFKHIVNLNRIKGYNAVNLKNGY